MCRNLSRRSLPSIRRQRHHIIRCEPQHDWFLTSMFRIWGIVGESVTDVSQWLLSQYGAVISAALMKP
jgi:hypothetical protein